MTSNKSDRLEVGEFCSTHPGGAIYEVVLVNESRAALRPLRSTSDDDLINISPRACVVRVAPEDAVEELLRPRNTTKQRKEDTMAVATIPVAEKSTKQRETERKAAVAEKKNSKPVKLAGAAAKAAANKKDAPPKTVRDCVCGCGGETTAYFIPGHDMRFKSWMIQVERGDLPVADLPKSIQKGFEFKKKGAGFVTTVNYRGEKHTGYDKKA